MCGTLWIVGVSNSVEICRAQQRFNAVLVWPVVITCSANISQELPQT